MRIYKREGSKSWWVYWKGKRRSLSVTDREAAERAFVAMQRRSVDPTYRAPDGATLSEELKAFGEEKAEKGRAPGTITMYQTHSRHLCAAGGRDTPLHEIDAEWVDRYVSRRTKEKASRSTRWKELCTLRGVLKRARRQRRYPYALDEVMPDDAQPDYVPGTRHLLLPDVRVLLGELDVTRAAVVAFLVATAADLGCVWRARPEDFRRGAEGELLAVHVRGSKTTHRHRDVPVLSVFADLAEFASRFVPFAPWPSCRRDLLRACRRARVQSVTARDLRRSHGRILRVAGIDPQHIGPMLGHAPGSPVTALSYAQLMPEELRALIEARTAVASKARVARGAQQGRKKKSA